MRLLGIDYGEKKIGLALGESEVQSAHPIGVLPHNGPETLTEIRDLAVREGVEAIVVGVPLSVGSFHSDEQLKMTRGFIERLRAVVALPIYEEDEAYTSAESIRLQREEGYTAPEDAIAAMLIVEQYLHRQ